MNEKNFEPVEQSPELFELLERKTENDYAAVVDLVN
jgi:hypothetical protein